MAPADPARTAERLAAVERHLRRVADLLPPRAEDLRPLTEASDGVVLHLWQAVQVVVDLATSWAVRAGLGSPPTYADAFRSLVHAGLLDAELGGRLARAAGFRNLVVHAYADLDLALVHATAVSGPADLRAFLAALVEAERHS